MKIFTCINDVCHEVDIRVDPAREGGFIASMDGREIYLEISESKPDSMTLAIDTCMGFYEFHSEKGKIAEVVHGNRTYKADVKDPQQQQAEQLLNEWGAGIGSSSTETKVTAQMPGKILGISVKVGDRIEPGQVVLVLEAMKMENEIASSVEGPVKSINVKVGDTVAAGDVLLEVQAAL
jgi:biotin carboxyl carrier protein